MKFIEAGNIVIEKEFIERNPFEVLIRAYRVENESPVAFLGKFIVPNNMTDEEIINLYK